MDARADGVASTRSRICRAARALFLDKAIEDVTLASIAAAAGVSHQTVLNHFESKEGVIVAVAEMFREETVDTRDATPGDVAGAVRALVDDYEQMGDANVRWIASSERMSTLAVLLDDARRGHQEWIVSDVRSVVAEVPGRSSPRRPRAARRDGCLRVEAPAP